MAVKYAVAKAVVGKEKTPHYYARAQYDGVTSMADMAQMVERISAVSAGDVLSVLNTLGTLISIELANGRIVDLGDLGRFRLSIRAKGVPKPSDVTRETIEATRAIFVPGHAIRLKQRNISFTVTREDPEERCPEDKPHDIPTLPEGSKDPESGKEKPKDPEGGTGSEGSNPSEKNNGGL